MTPHHKGEGTGTTEERQEPRGRVEEGPRRPLLFSCLVLAVIAGFLGIDHFSGLTAQFALGAATWLVLFASCARLDPDQRARVALVVLVATAAEILGSVILGAYTYRLENLPAFVPPGHGLVYLGGLAISQSALVRRHRRTFLISVGAIVVAWATAGLVILGRSDVLGALAGALLIYVLVRGRAPTLYAGVFLIVAFLEIYGTSIGAWHWADTAPGTPLPAGNPPSGIASIYVLFDISAIALAPRLLTGIHTLRRLPPLARFANAS